MSVFSSDVESKATLDAIVAELDADEQKLVALIDALIAKHVAALLAGLNAIVAQLDGVSVQLKVPTK
jgi:hypothetical protein